MVLSSGGCGPGSPGPLALLLCDVAPALKLAPVHASTAASEVHALEGFVGGLFAEGLRQGTPGFQYQYAGVDGALGILARADGGGPVGDYPSAATVSDRLAELPATRQAHGVELFVEHLDAVDLVAVVRHAVAQVDIAVGTMGDFGCGLARLGCGLGDLGQVAGHRVQGGEDVGGAGGVVGGLGGSLAVYHIFGAAGVVLDLGFHGWIPLCGLV